MTVFCLIESLGLFYHEYGIGLKTINKAEDKQSHSRWKIIPRVS